MAWKWDFWRRDLWRREGAKSAKSARGATRGNPFVVPGRSCEADPASELATRRRWEASLIDSGVSAEWARCLADRMWPVMRELGPDSESAVLRGALLAFATQADLTAEVESNLREVREVERLLRAFGGELDKLDEVLEVLAAYAQRMRTHRASKAAADDPVSPTNEAASEQTKTRRVLH
jgi:hypothetical protein